MEDTSPFARPVKHMNAVQMGMVEEEEGLALYDGPAHKASDRVQDQNLAVKQLYLRYDGTTGCLVESKN